MICNSVSFLKTQQSLSYSYLKFTCKDLWHRFSFCCVYNPQELDGSVSISLQPFDSSAPKWQYQLRECLHQHKEHRPLTQFITELTVSQYISLHWILTPFIVIYHQNTALIWNYYCYYPQSRWGKCSSKLWSRAETWNNLQLFSASAGP